MRRRMLVVAIFAVLLSGCTLDRLKALEKLYPAELGYARVDGRFCTSSPAVLRQKTKYLFVLDKSASNQAGFPDPLNPDDDSDTDASGNRRYGPLRQFLRNLVPDPNNLTSFSLINFNELAFTPLQNNMVQGFDPDANNFSSVVAAEWVGEGSVSSPEPVDRGFTNYVSALQMALNIIQADAQAESGNPARPIVTSAYRIVFVSDGIPNVVGGNGVLYTQDFVTDVLPAINNILALKSNAAISRYISDITLNTAYYFHDEENADAAALLQKMAIAGNGQYLQFGAGANIMYGAFAPPVRHVKYALSDVFVENENAVWWDDGRLLRDSDADGLPDEIERKAGSDMAKRDSDGNGVSDGVEYRLKGQPCADRACAIAARDAYSVCDGLLPAASAGLITFPDTDRDQLNDCEEFLLRSDRNNFNTNGTFVPDGVAFRANLPFIAGMDASQLQPQGDGVTNYMKLKQGMPLSIMVGKAPGFIPRLTALDRVEGPADLDCFHLAVENVAVLGFNNKLRVYVIENTAVIDDKPKMRFAERIVDSVSSAVRLSTEDFQ